jgi:hypothetical protein
VTRIVVDAATQAALKTGTTPVEVCDEAGNVLGRVLTDASFERIAARLLPWPTPAEIAEARAEMLARGGVSTEELLAHLDQVEREWDAGR